MQEWFDEVKAMYETENPDEKIELVFGGRRFFGKLREAIKGNKEIELPDIVSQIKTWMEPFIHNNTLDSIDKYLDTKAYGENTLWKDTFSQNILDILSVNGKSYFIPQNLNMHVFHYNKEIFSRFGLKIPRTWDEFEYVCNTLKSCNIIPTAIDGRYDLFNSWYYIRFAERLAGPDNLDKAAKGKISFKDHPGFIKAAEYISKFQENGWFQNKFTKYEYPSCQSLFCEGKTAMIFMGTWFCSEMIKQISQSMEIGIFPLPELKDSVAPRHEEIWANVFAIMNHSSKKEAAIKFLKILTSREMDVIKSKKMFLTVLKDGTFSREFENIQSILDNATSFGDTYNGLTCSCTEWYYDIFVNTASKLICGEMSASNFISVLDADTKAFYNR